jgi:hypothetical protein
VGDKWEDSTFPASRTRLDEIHSEKLNLLLNTQLKGIKCGLFTL